MRRLSIRLAGLWLLSLLSVGVSRAQNAATASSSPNPAPTLWVSTGEIRPGGSIEIRFPKPVVGQADLGTDAQSDLISVGKGLEGKINWVMPNLARFELTKAPAPGASAKVSIAKGKKYADGTPIPPSTIGELRVEPFRLEYSQILDRYTENFNLRESKYFLRFNAEVDAGAASSFFVFQDEAGRTIAAKVSPIPAEGHFQLRDTLTERFAAVIAERSKPTDTESDPDEEDEGEEDAETPGNRNAAFIVEPAAPLPVGEKWQLHLLDGFKDATGSFRVPTQKFAVGNIRRLQLSSVKAIVSAGEPRRLHLNFNKRFPSDAKPEDLGKFVRITPEIPEVTWKLEYSTLIAEGDFTSQDEWQVQVDATPDLVAADGTTLDEGKAETVKFFSVVPSLMLPLYDYQTQLAKGSRAYEIRAVNMKKVRVRVKYLEGENAIRAMQGYRYYTGASGTPQTVLPFELILGKTVFEKDFEVESGRDGLFKTSLNWDEVLASLGEEKRLGPGVFFLDVSGTPSEEAEDTLDPENDAKGYDHAQRLVQLTDIGLAWKFNDEQTFLYAYSCETGAPIPGAEVRLFGEDAKELGKFLTNDAGVVLLPRPEDAVHMTVSKGGDSCMAAYDSLNTVDLWNFPVRFDYAPSNRWRHRVFMFTDRNLYKPGEQMRLKGYARLQKDTEFKFPEGEKASLRIVDDMETILLEQEIVFGADGEFALDYRFPEGKVGDHSIYLEFEATKPEDDEEWWESEDRNFYHNVSVEEFRRNTFEITSKMPEIAPGQKEFSADYEAKYYLGQTLSESAVTWTISAQATGFYPEAYRDYLFGDHSRYDQNYWRHYFGFDDGEYYESGRTDREVGEGKLDDKGRFTLPVTLPDTKIPESRTVSLSVEITDKNQQTLRKRDTIQQHPSSVYAGIARLDSLLETGKPVAFDVVAVTPDGKRLTAPQNVHVKIERATHDTIRVETTSGVTTKSEKRLLPVTEADLTIDPAKNRNEFTYTPTEQGEHIITITGKDGADLPFQTIATHHVYGAGDYSWAYDNGMRVKIVPEKKQFSAGEEARLLVLTPVDGTALITVERTGVIRHFQQELTTENPVVTVPLEDGDAPNVFVSVLVIKGAKDSQRQHKEPVLKLGYCELLVDSPANTLAVTLKPARPEVRPGEDASITGNVVDAAGKPVANASVTLYAEDEGVLSVLGYQNPEPLKYFQEPIAIGLETGVSLDDFIPEDPQQIEYMRKGMTIGGGGFAELDDDTRKNFDPCAYWNATLKTDANGNFTGEFKVPDTLTRYRVIAVAASDAARFGTGASELLVNKPVMLEPVTPRHAHEGDQMIPKVVIHNKTTHEGTWKLTLLTGKGARFSDLPAEETSKSLEVTLAPNQTQVVGFPLALTETGDAKWTWEVTPQSVKDTTLNDALTRDLSDKVVSEFTVSYPRPLLHQDHFLALKPGADPVTFASAFDKELLEGRAEFIVQISSNPLIEAGGAFRYLLHYPYGCVEQTTSALMPWFAAKRLGPFLPSIDKSEAEIKSVIQKGADRLLTMLTPSGGLGYWPGASEPSDWSCGYGGLGLALAKQNGAFVPDSTLDKLAAYVIKRLGESTPQNSWENDTRALSLYFLAVAGKPQENWYDVMISRPDILSPAAAAWLALAMDSSGDDFKDRAAAFLKNYTDKRKKGADSGRWMPSHYETGTMLLARSRILRDDPETDKLFSTLLLKRNRNGHWGNTFSNSWSIQALAAWSEKFSAQTGDLTLAIQNSGLPDIVLTPEKPTAEVRVPVSKAAELALALTGESGTGYTRITLESKPQIQPLPASDQGFALSREYEKVLPDGTSKPATDLQIGDVVRVKLKVRAKEGSSYVSIDDPLPATLEGINPEFSSQSTASATQPYTWCAHFEIRDDRAVFFTDYLGANQDLEFSYLARVTGEGTVQVPPTLAEAMYEPEVRGFSSTMELSTTPKKVTLNPGSASSLADR